MRIVRKGLQLLVIASFLAILLSVGVAALPGQQHEAKAAYTYGRVCNNSSVSIWLTVEPWGKNWTVISLSAGQCTNSFQYDVEGIWGKRCDSSGRNCNYNGWKVSGFTTTTVKNGYLMPVSPGRTLFVSGSGQWLGSTNPGWPRPSLSSINYDLRQG